MHATIEQHRVSLNSRLQGHFWAIHNRMPCENIRQRIWQELRGESKVTGLHGCASIPVFRHCFADKSYLSRSIFIILKQYLK